MIYKQRMIFDGEPVTARLFYALVNIPVTTWRQALCLADVELLEQPNFGKTSLAEFKAIRDRRGFQCKPSGAAFIDVLDT